MKTLMLLIMISMFNSEYMLKMKKEFPDINTLNKKEYLVLPSCFQEYKDKYYISDAVESKIIIYNKNTKKYITTIGRKGSGPGDLKDPFTFCINPQNGNIVVADRGNSRISVFSSNGKYVESILTVGTIKSMFYIGKILCTMVFDNEKGVVFNFYENNKIVYKGGGIPAQDIVKNKDIFQAMYLMIGAQLYNNQIYVHSLYVPKVYVYDIRGNLINVINLDSSLMRDIYENNKHAKIRNYTIYVEHLLDGIVIKSDKIHVFCNKNKNIMLYNYNGKKADEIKMNTKMDDIYRLFGITNEGYIFRSPNSTIQIFN